MKDKIISFDDIQNMTTEKLLELYQSGYILESGSRLSKLSGFDIYSMSPDPVNILYAQGYDQGSGKMTVDLLVRNHNPTQLVVKFKFYSTDATPIFLKDHTACIPPYSQVSNVIGCTKVRVSDIPLKDPYRIYTYRCVDTPNCAIPSCVRFDEVNVDSAYTGIIIRWDGTIPPLTDFPPSGAVPNIDVECASCDASWTCMTDPFGNRTGYKYDSCTQQTVWDPTTCPPQLPPSKISITTDSPSPFDKNQTVRFYGILESADWDVTCLCYPNIASADVRLVIRVGGASVVDTHLTTISVAEGFTPNYTYDWIVPGTIAGTDTTGMSVTVTVDFAGNAQYQATSNTTNYAIVGTACTAIAVTASKATANVGDKITLTAITEPTTGAFPVIFKANGVRLATGCTTMTLSPMLSTIPRIWSNKNPEIRSLQNSVSMLNVPSSVMSGQTIRLQISYNLSVDLFGEWVKFRVCDTLTSDELGRNIEILFGNATGTVTVDVTIPTGITTITLRAEVTRNELSYTCGDSDVMASTAATVNVTSQNILTIIDQPTSLVAGQSVDFKISYILTVSNWGEWVRFRICDSAGNELGYNIEPLFGDSTGIILVSTAISSEATGSISLKAEVTSNALSSTCGDPDVISSTSLISIPVVIQASGTLSIVNPPVAVRSGRAVDFNVGYNITVSDLGEWVRFRICSGGTQLGYKIKVLFGHSSGIVTINTTIPSGATESIPIKSEVTSNASSGTCGDPGVLASSTTIDIPITTAQPGTCEIVWDTTGQSGGIYYIQAEVLGQCSTPTPLAITLIPPPPTCTSISLGISDPNPIVGDVVVLTAITSPFADIFQVIFKANNKTIGTGCITSTGRCTAIWNTTGLSPGTYRLIATVEDQSCISTPLDISLASTTPTCQSITTPNANPATATIGGTVVLTANVQPTTTVFPVDFKDQNNITIGTVNTVSGVATLNWNTAGKTTGTYQIKAHVGTQCVSPTAVQVTLNPAAACTSISTPTASPSTTIIGTLVTLSATVQPTTSVFTVDFKDQNNNIIGSANTTNGIATYPWNTTGKTTGTYQIKAYTGTCTSPATVQVTLNPAITCVSITDPTATPTTVTIGGTVALTVTAQPTTSIFTVTFKDQNNTILGTATTLNGIAILNWNTTGKTAGIYQIKGYADSCTSTTATPVTLNAPTTACTSITVPVVTPSTVRVGEVMTLSATAQPTTATFTVDFKDQNNNLIGSANTTSGIASYVWNTANVVSGTYQVKAYVGAQCVSSSPAQVTINPTTATCTSISTPIAMPTSVTVGQILALRAQVQPTTSIFTVDFKDQNNTIIGSGNTVSGVATINWNTTGKTAGTYQIKAYTGTCVSPGSVQITITSAGGVGSIIFITTDAGEPLEGAEITVDGVPRGITGSNGRLPSPVAGLTIGITHLWTATKTGYPSQSGSKLLNTDETITIDMSVVPTAGAGGAIMIAGVAAIGAAYFMMRKPSPPKA